MKQYKDLLKHIIEENKSYNFRDDRTGVTTLSSFGYQMRFNLNNGFPAQTTKKLAWTAVVAELLWFLEGSDDERRLAELTHGQPRTRLKNLRTIWTDNADNQGVALGYRNDELHKFLGPVYGVQWRMFGDSKGNSYVDQISEVIQEIKTNPTSRRLVVNAWHAYDVKECALPPCHVMFQFYVKNNQLSCHMYQRSADAFLGVPFNIASYALLTHIIARECKLGVGDLVISFGDVHIYKNHLEAVSEVLSRQEYDLPTLLIDDGFNLKEVLAGATPLSTAKNMFHLQEYKFHPVIKASMAV